MSGCGKEPVTDTPTTNSEPVEGGTLLTLAEERGIREESCPRQEDPQLVPLFSSDEARSGRSGYLSHFPL